MKKLTIDIETRSSIDITLSGLYKYAESPDFYILLFSVSIDDIVPPVVSIRIFFTIIPSFYVLINKTYIYINLVCF